MKDYKSEMMASFYRQCQEKGWTDMTDETHRLKAKVIASDLGLKYSKLDALYEKARECYEAEEKERERQRREKERLEALQKAEGELILAFSKSEDDTAVSGKTVRVYRLPDGSLYHIDSESAEKRDGPPQIMLKSGDATLYTYQPSRTVYTSATVGGVTTGGFSETGSSIGVVRSQSDKGDLTIGNDFVVKHVILPEAVRYAFRRDPRFKSCANGRTIPLFCESALANAYSAAVRGAMESRDTMQMVNAIRLEAEARRLSMDECRSIMGLLQDILNNKYPPTDPELFRRAQELARSEKTVELKEACRLLEELQDSREIPQEQSLPILKQVKEKYEELHQQEKEAAILAKEAREKHTKKILAILIPAVLLCLAAFLVITKVILPGNAYKNAVSLFEAGQYDEAIAAFEAMDGYKDSAEQVELVKQEKAYQAALSLFENKQYDEAVRAFKALGSYKDSKEQIELVQEAKYEPDYQAAIALFEAGKYDSAIAAFEALGDYKDSAEQAVKCGEAKAEEAYQAALALLEKKQYDKAIAAFEALGDYKDSAEQAVKCGEAKSEEAYQKALSLEESGESYAAATAYYAVGDYKDARERCFALWGTLTQRETLSAGFDHTVGLKADGTVIAVGDYRGGQCNVGDWTDIVAVAAGDEHTVGLKADGTVVATKVPWYTNEGQCNVGDWADIVAVSAGDKHTVGLKADGTVVAVGYNVYGQCEVGGWRDIVAVSAGGTHTVGLRADGTVVAVGNQHYGMCDVGGWRDIVAVSAGGIHTVGLRADGTVVAVGRNAEGQCEVGDWTDIVAVFAGGYQTIGLKADGTVIAVGKNDYGQRDVGDWADIVAVSPASMHTVGLKADGTAVAVGRSYGGRCDVGDWKLKVLG